MKFIELLSFAIADLLPNSISVPNILSKYPPSVDKSTFICYILFVIDVDTSTFEQKRQKGSLFGGNDVSMVDRFEKLTIGVAQIYKSIQRIKKYQMNEIGLKGTHVMCIYYLSNHPDGLTAADLCEICKEDKAGISRILSDLEHGGFIRYESANDKKYRAKAILTPEGQTCANTVNDMILRATQKGGIGITDAERDIFYRVLFLISDNLNQLCAELENSETLRSPSPLLDEKGATV